MTVITTTKSGIPNIKTILLIFFILFQARVYTIWGIKTGLFVNAYENNLDSYHAQSASRCDDRKKGSIEYGEYSSK